MTNSKQKPDPKAIFANNLKRILQERNKTQSDLVQDLSFTSSTVSDWVNAKKYPRVDKMQILADYFGILKSELTEEQADLKDDLIDNTNTSSDFIIPERLINLAIEIEALPEEDREALYNVIETFLNMRNK